MKNNQLFTDPQTLVPASLDWRDGDPWAADFDDIYASSAGAIEEKRHVFLQANQLASRFQKLYAGQHFSILELGFGTGLNFLLTWELWQQHIEQDAIPNPSPLTNIASSVSPRLFYTSIESRPMALPDMQKCHGQWPELASLAKQLQQQLPINIKGFHQLTFNNVTLILIQAPVTEALAQFHGAIDAIYLDGFSPSKNADMWQTGVLQSMAKYCHQHTTVATYSVARGVKDVLEKAGFAYQTMPGFGQKKEQLLGTYQGTAGANKRGPQQPLRNSQTSPWQQLPPPLPVISKDFTANNTSPKDAAPKAVTIAVVGAGISGCMTALALQERGYDVQLIDQADHIAAGASGNRQGILYTKVPEKITLTGQLQQQGLLYSLACLRQHYADACFHPTGLLQLAPTESICQQMLRASERGFPEHWLRFVSPTQASQLCNWAIKHHGIYLAQSGWVNPSQWCQALENQLRKKPWLSTQVTGLNSSAQGWCLSLQKTAAAKLNQAELSGASNSNSMTTQATFAGVVFCNAHHAADLLQALALPLGRIRGQVTYLKSDQAPSTVVCSEGYITPSNEGIMGVGASYNFTETSLALAEQDDQNNLRALQHHQPNISAKQIVGGRASFRANTPDYLPLVGGVADADAMLVRFAHLRQDKNYRFNVSMPWLKGLYVNAGHGSKGLITAPLCAQLLAAQISGEPLPVSKTISDGLSANRFFLRDMIRRRR